MSVTNKSADEILGQITDWTNGVINVSDVGVLSNADVPSGTKTATWAASALINTYKIVDITKPDAPQAQNHILAIKNPSSITDLTAIIGNTRVLADTGETFCQLASFSIPKATALVIEDCEDAWNEQAVAEVTSAADSSDKKVGSNSQKFTITEDFTTGIIGSEAFTAVNLSLYNTLRLWIKSDVATADGDIQILLDDTAECASPVETLSVPTLVAATWTLVYLPLTNPASDTAIISIGAKLNTDLGAQNINIDDIQALYITAKDIPINKLFIGDVDGQLILRNDTALGANDAFSAYVQIVEA